MEKIYTAYKMDYSWDLDMENLGSEFVAFEVKDKEPYNYVFAAKKDGIAYIIPMTIGNMSVDYFLKDINRAKKNNGIEWK
ncbi:MAG: hypothetical protein J6S84_11045 [Bacteroidales bacterium]|nr:hypothetical protein [Bacteroidales bacterium]